MGLKSLGVKGFFWNSIGTVGSGLVNLLVTMILARMLTPQDFGVLAILIVFSLISDVIVDSGFSQSIIKERTTSQETLTSIFYVNILIALGLYIVLFALAPAIASFYKTPELVSLSRVTFLTIIFNSIGLIPNALFNQDINFKAPAYSALISMIVAGALAVALAYMGLGIWSLVCNLVVFSFLKSTLLCLQNPWKPRGWIKLNSIKRHFQFGKHLLVQGLVDRIVTNLESLLIGKYYTKESLGYYSQSGKLNTYVSATSSSVLQRVTYPLLSKLSDSSEELKAGFRKVFTWACFFLFPIYTMLFFSAREVMVVLFGSQWAGAAPYLALWSISGLALSVYSLFINSFLILDQTKLYMRLSLLKQGLKIVVVVTTIQISVFAVMWGVMITTLITGGLYIAFSCRLLCYNFKEMFQDAFQPLVASSLCGFVIALLGRIPTLTNSIEICKLLTYVVITTILYLGFMLLTRNKTLFEILNLLPKRNTKL